MKDVRAYLSTVVNAMSALLAEVDMQREEDERLRNERQVTYWHIIILAHLIIEIFNLSILIHKILLLQK